MLLQHVEGLRSKVRLVYQCRVARRESLEKDNVLASMPGKKRQESLQKKQWLDDITQWSGKCLVNVPRGGQTYINASFMKSPTLVCRARQVIIIISGKAILCFRLQLAKK